MPNEYNKGEWSELYVFFVIIKDRKLFEANGDLEIDKEKFIIVKKITREEQISVKEYGLLDDNNIELVTGDLKKIIKINKEHFEEKITNIFKEIKESKKVFTVPSSVELMEEFNCDQPMALSENKADLVLSVLNRMGSMEEKIGYSIKSFVGGNPTLLNSSQSTNFIYEVSGYTGEEKIVNDIDGRSKVRDRLKSIIDSGGQLKFIKTQSQVFEKNLRMIDDGLPEILSHLLLYYYLGKGKYFPELLEVLKNDSSTVFFERQYNESHFEYKIKSLLINSALGMVPTIEWNGIQKANGGYIIVRDDGGVGCYQPYDANKFLDYLYKTTYIDTPSTTRHRFGDLYIGDDKLYFKLNFQIRYKA